MGYNSNVFAETGSGRDDFLGSLVVDVPVSYKRNPRFDVLARYVNVSERYQTFSEFDDLRARSHGALGLRFGRPGRTELRLDGIYRETNHPAEIFTDTGVELGRATTTTYGGSANLTQGLGARATLELGYSYRNNEVTSVEDQVHVASVALSNGFGQRTRLGVRALADRRISESHEHFDTAAALAEWKQEISPRLSFSTSAGARFLETGEVRPEAHASMHWERGRWGVDAHYAHTLGYIPRQTDLVERIGDTDTAGLQVLFQSRRFRFWAGPAFYWTRNVSLDARVWRGLAEASFMATNWLGLKASYSYLWQTGTVETAIGQQDVDATRHLAQFGVLIAPWNRRGAEGLP